MNQRDFSELRRRLNPDRHNPSVIRGCYVTHDGQMISTFAQPVFGMAQEENEKYIPFSLLNRIRNVLSSVRQHISC